MGVWGSALRWPDMGVCRLVQNGDSFFEKGHARVDVPHLDESVYGFSSNLLSEQS